LTQKSEDASVECGINFAKTFDVADEPITEGIVFRIDASTSIRQTVINFLVGIKQIFTIEILVTIRTD
jgi:hypothetical protein